MDLAIVEALYQKSVDPTALPEDRGEAGQYLKANEDAIIAEFLAQPENLRFATFDEFVGYVLFWLIRIPGESSEQYRAREDKLRADKSGIIVRHVLREKAKALRKTDFDFINLFGDGFYLALWPPHTVNGLPAPTPNEVLLQL
jgi:hypothetical protein